MTLRLVFLAALFGGLVFGALTLAAAAIEAPIKARADTAQSACPTPRC